MTVQAIWEILENGNWESTRTIKETSGIDENTLQRIVNFLQRWNFIEVQESRGLIRRKPGMISPLETFNLLRSIGTAEPASSHDWLAERVACRVCHGRILTPTGKNEVECTQCHEKQWSTIERKDKSMMEAIEPETLEPPRELNLLSRSLVRLGFPQKAFHANIPNSTQYFQFRCMSCGKVSTDYPHSHSRYLTCPACESRNQFW
jgi:Zn finger protein HypA/HybF involved in hydrogenase expression